jgi:hypothetical protein
MKRKSASPGTGRNATPKTRNTVPTITEEINLMRVDGRAVIENQERLTLRAIQTLVHEVAPYVVSLMVHEYKVKYRMVRGKLPDHICLTEQENEVLERATKKDVHVREEQHPWSAQDYTEYMGMQIIVCPDAETERRKIES